MGILRTALYCRLSKDDDSPGDKLRHFLTISAQNLHDNICGSSTNCLYCRKEFSLLPHHKLLHLQI